MSQFVKIANKNEVPEGTAMSKDIEGKSIALFNLAGSFYAMNNLCAHRGGPLAEGNFEGEEVICPWHAWQYNVKTGECTSSPSICQKKYPVKIEGEEVLVDIS